MAWTKVINSTPVEILLDDGGADVRRTRNCRRISKACTDGSHNGRDRALRLRLALGDAVLAERHGREQRPAPGAEILGCEVLAHVLLDVVVELAAGEVAKAAGLLVDVAEKAPAALRRAQLSDAGRELLVDQRRPDQRAVLSAIAERDPAAADLHVAPAQRRDPERAKTLRVPLVSHAEPAEVDQPDRDRGRPLEGQRLLLDVLRHRSWEDGQFLAEADELVELRLLLARSKLGVVEGLHPAGAVDTRCLQLGVGSRRDPDVAPGGRDAQRLDPRECSLVGGPLSARVHVAESYPRPQPPPPSPSSPRV